MGGLLGTRTSTLMHFGTPPEPADLAEPLGSLGDGHLDERDHPHPPNDPRDAPVTCAELDSIGVEMASLLRDHLAVVRNEVLPAVFDHLQESQRVVLQIAV